MPDPSDTSAPESSVVGSTCQGMWNGWSGWSGWSGLGVETLETTPLNRGTREALVLGAHPPRDSDADLSNLSTGIHVVKLP